MSATGPVRIDFVGEQLRIYQGSPWEMTQTYFQIGETGQYVAEILENPAVNKWNLKIIGGLPLNLVADSDSWDIGDFVYVQKVLGAWTIIGPCDLEDMSSYTSGLMQVKQDENSPTLCTLNLDADADQPGFYLEPTATDSIQFKIPGAHTDLLQPYTYWYDLWLNDEIKQHGRIEVYKRITRVEG